MNAPLKTAHSGPTSRSPFPGAESNGARLNQVLSAVALLFLLKTKLPAWGSRLLSKRMGEGTLGYTWCAIYRWLSCKFAARGALITCMLWSEAICEGTVLYKYKGRSWRTLRILSKKKVGGRSTPYEVPSSCHLSH